MSTADDPNRVLLVGDLHGRTQAALEVIDHAVAVGADLVVQLGDFGYQPARPSSATFLQVVEDRLAEHDLELWWLEGDHDQLPDLPLDGQGRVRVAAHIVYLPRGHRWNWGSATWLALGGAESITGRPGPSTPLTDEQADQIIAVGSADVIVAHDAPWSAPLTGGTPNGPLARHLGQDLAWEERLDAMFWDADRIAASDGHQQRLRRITDACLTPGGLWAHGHHHRRYSHLIQPADWRVEGLGVAGQPLEQLTLLVDRWGCAIPEG